VSGHAAFEEPDASLVVRLLLKFKRSTVFHELFEFRWVATAKVFKRCFNLLFLDGSILFVLASAGKALPWK